MSDALRAPRHAAAEMIVDAAGTAIATLTETMGAAAARASEALKAATTQDEIERIRDVYVAGLAHLGSTPFVRR